MGIQNQLRSVIQWESPEEWELVRSFTDRGDELKNASKLILQPGQGCIFTYEGKVEEVFTEEGLYNLKTDNKPFITTIRKFMNFFESEHKAKIWFFRTADIVNVRWGTRIPITYNDPVYGFPVKLRGFGNYSLKISKPTEFFSNIVGGKESYFCTDLKELFLSRITQPISNYLANAKFSYAEIDSHIEEIAKEAQLKTASVFSELGFQVLDFRIEGTSFDDETNKRIGEISDVQADVKAANIAGVDFAELQKLRALRDAANNEGTTGATMGMFAGMDLGKMTSSDNTKSSNNDSPREKLKTLKGLFDDDLISEEEYYQKKNEILKNM